MITVYHLNRSRSQRILWLMEELGLEYEIAYYQRDPETLMAPPEMKALHPLGKSPMISDKGRVRIESGAIIEYVLRHYGEGRLQPDPASPEYDDMIEWLQYAEGSAAMPLMLKIYGTYHQVKEQGFLDGADHQVDLQLSYIDGALDGRDFLVGNRFSAADVQMSFVGETAEAFGSLAAYSNMSRWLRALQARPAYLRAIERGGEYSIAMKDDA